MKFLSGKEAAQYLENIVYAKKQVHKYCVDLTVARIYKLTGGGSLDFGGGEYKESDKKVLKPKKKNVEDDYGWWNLDRGSYLVKFNERFTIAPGQKALVQSHPRFVKAGAVHPVLYTEASGEIVISVQILTRLNIKENARISELRIIETDQI